jgi:hypothetical protein
LLSSRLNSIADGAVVRDYGITGLKQNTAEIKMKRQEAVIEELLSMILEGGVRGHSSERNEEHGAGQGHEDGGDVNLDEILFLLRSQQHELQEIRESNRNKGHHPLPHSLPHDGDDDEQNNSPYGVSSYYNGPQHNSSPDEGGGLDTRRSLSPQRSVSRWIGGGTSHSHHLQGKDNKFKYAPTNHHRRTSHHSRSASPLRTAETTPYSSLDQHELRQYEDPHPIDAYHTRLASTLEHDHRSPSPSPSQLSHDQSATMALTAVSSPLRDIADIATDMVRMSKEIVQETLLPPPPPPPLPPPPLSTLPSSHYKLSKVSLRNSPPQATPSPPFSLSSHEHRVKTTPLITPYHPTPTGQAREQEDEENETNNTSVWNISGSSGESPQEEMRQLPSTSSFITTSQPARLQTHPMTSPTKLGGRAMEKSNSLLTRTANGYAVLEHSHQRRPSTSVEDPLILALSPEYHQSTIYSPEDPKNLNWNSPHAGSGGRGAVRRSPSPKKKPEFFSQEDLVEEIHSHHTSTNRNKSIPENIEELQTQLSKWVTLALPCPLVFSSLWRIDWPLTLLTDIERDLRKLKMRNLVLVMSSLLPLPLR